MQWSLEMDPHWLNVTSRASNTTMWIFELNQSKISTNKLISYLFELHTWRHGWWSFDQRYNLWTQTTNRKEPKYSLPVSVCVQLFRRTFHWFDGLEILWNIASFVSIKSKVNWRKDKRTLIDAASEWVTWKSYSTHQSAFSGIKNTKKIQQRPIEVNEN